MRLRACSRQDTSLLRTNRVILTIGHCHEVDRHITQPCSGPCSLMLPGLVPAISQEGRYICTSAPCDSSLPFDTIPRIIAPCQCTDRLLGVSTAVARSKEDPLPRCRVIAFGSCTMRSLGSCTRGEMMWENADKVRKDRVKPRLISSHGQCGARELLKCGVSSCRWALNRSGIVSVRRCDKLWAAMVCAL